MGASKTITFSDLRSQGIELLRWSLGQSSGAEQWPLANRMHDFNPCDRTAGRPKRVEAQQGTRNTFARPLIWLHEVIEIFGMADDDRGLGRFVVVRTRRRIRATLIDGDFLRQSLTAHSFV
jgi:hypothetical protein